MPHASLFLCSCMPTNAMTTKPMPLVSTSFNTVVDGGDSEGFGLGGIYDEYTSFGIFPEVYYKQ